MKSFLFLGSLMAIALTAFAGNANAKTNAAADGNNAFAFAFFHRVEKPGANLFFSPISIRTAFAMVAEGAAGKTRTQLNDTFHFANDDLAGSVLQKQFAALSSAKDFQLNLANGIWIEKTFAVKQSFREALKKSFSSEIQSADFIHKANAEREKINRWVAEKTQQKIRHFFPPHSINASTRLTLANAVYFKGLWANRFDKAMTKNGDFHLANDEVVKTPMMRQAKHFDYAEDAKAQYVRLPCKGKRISMVIVLGNAAESAKAKSANDEQGKQFSAAPKISPKDLSAALKKMQSQEVAVSLPRFKLESSYKLTKTLKQMGVTNAFSDAADFSGIDGKRDLSISAAFHKAFISVDEKGTEAAAATGIVMRYMAVAPKILRANHPFLFFIMDDQTGAILFMGKFAKPESGE